MYATPAPEYETITLEKLRIALHQRITPELLLDPKIDVEKVIGFVADEIAVSVRGYVWAEHVDTIKIEYPLDWWEALKERWFPAWAKVRWPVRYRTHVIDVKASYPDYKFSVPEHTPYLHLYRQEY